VASPAEISHCWLQDRIRIKIFVGANPERNMVGLPIANFVKQIKLQFCGSSRGHHVLVQEKIAANATDVTDVEGKISFGIRCFTLIC
jgi:hypothetical protein